MWELKLPSTSPLASATHPAGTSMSVWVDALAHQEGGHVVMVSASGHQLAIDRLKDLLMSLNRSGSSRGWTVPPLAWNGAAPAPLLEWQPGVWSIQHETVEGIAHMVARWVPPNGSEKKTLWGPKTHLGLFRDWLATTDIPWWSDWLVWMYDQAQDEDLVTPVTVLADPDSPWHGWQAISVQPNADTIMAELIQEGIHLHKIALPDDPAKPVIAPMPEDETLDAYLNTYAETLTHHMATQIHVRWTPGRPVHPVINTLLRKPVPAQADVIEAGARTLTAMKSVIVDGKMGVGKTLIGASMPYRHTEGRPFRAIVMAPGHLVPKWAREIHQTVPGAVATILRNWKDVQDYIAAHPEPPQDMEYVVIGRDAAKLSYSIRPTAITKPARHPHLAPENQLVYCPACGTAQAKKKAYNIREPYTWSEWMLKAFHRGVACDTCGTPLWSADKNGIRRLSLVEALKRWSPRGYWQYAIVDEFHELKEGDSAQGEAFGRLLSLAPFKIALSGTITGGYADDLYYVLWRMDPAQMKRDGWDYSDMSRARFHDQFGTTEVTTREKDAKLTVTRKRRPGISPLLLGRYLLNRTIFLQLEDLGITLPPYHEPAPIAVPMDEDLQEAYAAIKTSVGEALLKITRERSTPYLPEAAALIQTLLTYPDRPWDNEPVEIRSGKTVIETVPLPDLDPAIRRAKERKLQEIVQAQLQRGRRMTVYIQAINKRAVTERIVELVQEAGAQAAVLTSNVAPERREAWIAEQVRRGAQVLITHPRLVSTGLDLLDFPTIIWYQAGYSLTEIQQASRRSWRIGQTEPVEVLYLVWQHSLQETALKLVGSKLIAAMGLEGVFHHDGLAELGQVDITTALARAIIGKMPETNTLEALWADMAAKGQQGNPLGIGSPTPITTSVEPEDAVVAPVAVSTDPIDGDFIIVRPTRVTRRRQAAEDSLTVGQLGWAF